MCMWRKWTQAHAGIVHQNSKQSTCRRLMTFDASITNNLLDTIYQTDVPKNRSISPCLECSQFRSSTLWNNTILFPLPMLTFFSPVSSNLKNLSWKISNPITQWMFKKNWMTKAGEARVEGKKAASNRCRYSFWCHWKPRTLIELRFLFPSIVRCAIDKSSIILCVHVRVHVSGGYVRSTLRVCGFR